MVKVIKNDDMNIPVKMWLDDIEDGALEQAINLSKLQFAFKHIALMPDSHQGYGMPIGGVLATKGVVIPNAVGVDIGCGMRAVKTNVTELAIEELKRIIGYIREAIPTGFEHNKELLNDDIFNSAPDLKIIQDQIDPAKKQLCSLGGGNHFIEIQKGSDGFIWIMLHSGSRNLGYKTAKHFYDIAKYKCELWYSDIPDKDLSFFPIEEKEARDYMSAMNFCLDFAKRNRELMMDRCKSVFEKIHKNIDFIEEIDIHHNYAQYENHFNNNVIIHRKGAILVRKDQIGIIPGSQGTKSYIVKGKGNQDSFMSCSHGAGRIMSRKKAVEELDYDFEIKKMNDLGVLHSIRNKDDLDEASGAYKDIDVVMENQKDLVDIEVELTPLAVIKASSGSNKHNKKRSRQLKNT